MTKIDKYLNEISDKENPEFIFQTTHTKLLVQIVNGKLNPKKAAMKELDNRGLDKKGKWVGFK